MVQIGLSPSGRNGQLSSQLRVELSNEWPMKQIPHQHRQGNAYNSPSRRRYVDSFAVTSEPQYVQPRSATGSTTTGTSTLTCSALSTAYKYGNQNGGGTGESKTGEGGMTVSGGGVAAKTGGAATRPTSNYVASTLIECGVEHHDCGEHEKALKAFRAALKAQKLSLGDEHLCIAHTLGNMGAVYLKQGRLFLASQALEEAIRMKLKFRIAEDDPKHSKIYLGDILNNLGNVAYLRGDYTTSLKYYKTTLKDARRFDKQREKDCRDDSNEEEETRSDDNKNQEQKYLLHKEVANALHNIGRLHIHQNEWDAALSVLTECHRMEEALYGADNIRLASTLELIGFVHFSSSNLDAAMTYFSQALPMHRNAHGPLHEDVATCLLHIGMVQEATGDVKDAWEIFTKSRDIFVRVGVDFSHRGLKAARRSIASIEHLLSNEVEQQQQQRQKRESNKRPHHNQFVTIEQREMGDARHFEA